MKAKKLSELLNSVVTIPTELDRVVTGLTSDSRQIQANELFIAYPGGSFDGRQFIIAAVQQGAIAVLQEADGNATNKLYQIADQTIPIINIPRLREYIGIIAARFYQDPTKALTIYGTTGTNGKTSCTQFIARALNMAHIPCATMGTLGNGFPDQLQPAALTTADAITLQHDFAHFKQQGAKAVAMEVSSHSLDQHRINGIHFNTAIFTNLTRDHLDYHGTMKNYGQAKRKLFLQPGLQHAIINADDEFGRQLIKEFTPRLPVYAYTLTAQVVNAPLISATDIKLDNQGFSAHIHSPWGDGKLTSHLLGRFNLGNLLAVLGALCATNIPLAKALHYLANLPTVDGRMQTFGGDNLPLVVVDYSHTPDSLEKALTALREHCQGQLWCVFGCGGNRDPGKRPIMGQIAERYSDQLIITDDNPRFENPQAIIDAIVEGLLCPWAAEVEHNRAAAIAHVIDCAEAGDIVLIAGKGHETYQQIGAEKIPFNDAEYVQQSLQQKTSGSR